MLSTARLLNQALALLSPLLLVRLLDIVEYGRYRQFMATAMLITSLGGFALTANLNYLHRAHARTRRVGHHQDHRAHAAASAFVSALIVAAGRQWIVPDEIASSWVLLAVYVFLFLNLEVLVAYWLAHGQSAKVMAYTLIVTVWRLGTLLGAAF